MSQVKIDVSLYSFNRQAALDHMFISAMQCHDSDTGIVLVKKCDKDYDNEFKARLIQRVLDQGHTSIAENCEFHFVVGGISRACSHQVVRNREASYAQQSQRHVDMGEDFPYIVPPSIKVNAKSFDIFASIMVAIAKAYCDLLDLGIPEEDARYVLPNACATGLTWHMNLRELMLVCNERLCAHAQWEIRDLVRSMRGNAIIAFPWLHRYLVPKCDVCGFCREKESCGRRPHRDA